MSDVKYLLALACLAAGCSRSLVVPPDQPADFDATCASGGMRACRTACERGKADACLVIAHGYDAGAGGLRKNHAARNRWEERACALGSARGCGWLSRSLAQKGPAQDEERAKSLRAKACDGGDPNVCMKAAGDAFDADDVRLGFARIERACVGRVWDGCAALGDLHRYGIGTERDAEMAEKVYRLACEQKDEAACTNLEGPGTWLSAPIVRFKAVFAPDPPIQELVEYASSLPTNVVIAFCIDATGRTVDRRVREPSSNPGIDTVALETIRTWRFHIAGMPDDARMCTSVKFELRTP